MNLKKEKKNYFHKKKTGAVIGIILFEKWANNKEDAIKLCENGEVTFEPNHNHDSWYKKKKKNLYWDVEKVHFLKRCITS